MVSGGISTYGDQPARTHKITYPSSHKLSPSNEALSCLPGRIRRDSSQPGTTLWNSKKLLNKLDSGQQAEDTETPRNTEGQSRCCLTHITDAFTKPSCHLSGHRIATRRSSVLTRIASYKGGTPDTPTSIEIKISIAINISDARTCRASKITIE